MKKLTVLFLLGIFALSACRKNVTRVERVDQAYSAVYDILPSDWQTSDNGISYSTTFDVPELSGAIFDHGAVIVYLSFYDNKYEALPEVFDGIAYGAIHSPGSVTVELHAVDGSLLEGPGGEVYAKIVLIDAQQLSLHPGVNLQNYNEVKQVFHIR
jgi:hypothetical protein